MVSIVMATILMLGMGSSLAAPSPDYISMVEKKVEQTDLLRTELDEYSWLMEPYTSDMLSAQIDTAILNMKNIIAKINDYKPVEDDIEQLSKLLAMVEIHIKLAQHLQQAISLEKKLTIISNSRKDIIDGIKRLHDTIASGKKILNNSRQLSNDHNVLEKKYFEPLYKKFNAFEKWYQQIINEQLLTITKK